MPDLEAMQDKIRYFTECGCGKKLGKKNRSGRCPSCAAKDPATIARKLVRTPEQIERHKEHCRRMSADPAIVKKRTAAMMKTMGNDPFAKANHAKACKAAKDRQKADPVALEAMRANGRRVGGSRFWDGLSPERREEERRKRRAASLAWCPEEHWELNHRLKRQGYRLEERKDIILAEVPGTQQHARRQIENIAIAQRMRAEKEAAQRY